MYSELYQTFKLKLFKNIKPLILANVILTSNLDQEINNSDVMISKYNVPAFTGFRHFLRLTADSSPNDLLHKIYTQKTNAC